MSPDVAVTAFVLFALVFIAIGAKLVAVFGVGRFVSENNSILTSTGRWRIRVLNTIAVIAFFASWGFVAFVFGAYIASIGLYDRLSHEKQQLAKVALNSEDFAQIEIGKTSDGHIVLTGSVGDSTTRDQLIDKMRSTFGDSEATTITELVKVRK